MTVQDKLATVIQDYLDTQRPAGFPLAAALPVRLEAEETTRPLPVVIVGIDDSEELLPLRANYRIEGYVELVSQPHETTAANHRTWAGCLMDSLSTQGIKDAANAPATGRAASDFHLYELFVTGAETSHDGDEFTSRIGFSAVAVGKDGAP